MFVACAPTQFSVFVEVLSGQPIQFNHGILAESLMSIITLILLYCNEKSQGPRSTLSLPQIKFLSSILKS